MDRVLLGKDFVTLEDLEEHVEVAFGDYEAQESRIADIAGQLDVLKDEVDGHTDHQV